MSNKDNKYQHHHIEQLKLPSIGRENDELALRNLLVNESNVVIVEGAPGEGKNVFCKSFFTPYRDDYDIITAIGDFNYGVYSLETYFKHHFQTDFKTLKEFLRTTKQRYFLFVSNMPQFDDNDILEKISEFLPIDSPKSLQPFQHIVILRNQRIPKDLNFSHIPTLKLNNLSKESAELIFKRTLERDLTPEELELLVGLNNYNPHFIVTLSKYINERKLESEKLKALIEKISGDDPKRKLFKIILDEFKSNSALYKLLCSFVWLHSYEVECSWLDYIAEKQLLLIKSDARQFISQLLNMGLVREVRENTSFIPSKSSMFLLRELIQEETPGNQYFADFILYMMSLLRIPGVSAIDLQSIYRQLIYYIDAEHLFRDNIDKAILSMVCAEGYFSTYSKPNIALPLINKALALLPPSEELIRARCHKILGLIYKHPDIKDYDKSVSDLKKAFDVYLANAKKQFFNLHSYLLNEIGDCYEKLSDYKLALKYHEDALANTTERTLEYTESLYFMGRVQFLLKDYKLSAHTLRQALGSSKKYQHHHLIPDIIAALAKSFLYSGEKAKALETIDSLKTFETPQNTSVIEMKIIMFKRIIQEFESQNSTKYYYLGGILTLTLIGLVIYKKYYK